METEKPLTEHASLALIDQMIRRAQKGVADNGFYFLLWGWLVFIAAIACYIMVVIYQTDLNWLPWAILMPVGGIASAVYGQRQEKTERAKSYTGSVLKYVNIACGVSLGIVLLFLSQLANWTIAYSMLMMIYGCWLFISGGVMRFRPLIIGGIINWCCAVVGLLLLIDRSSPHYEIILLLAFAVLAGYIIPGHLLNARYNRETNETV
ncbi:MAG TPA: hypothetical protein VI731_08505 [Bacteroidia bacterium]|nr:hypothetical protein [Bacteroidia bacterium]